MPSRRRSSTVVRPIGFGRRGDRVANTPCGRLSEGGVPSNSSPRNSSRCPCNSSLGERSNSQRTMRCEKPSMSVSPGSNSGRILSTPSTSCLAPRPLGTSLASLYGLLTNPIGREVNIRDSASISHTNAEGPSVASELDGLVMTFNANYGEPRPSEAWTGHPRKLHLDTLGHSPCCLGNNPVFHGEVFGLSFGFPRYRSASV